MLADQVRVATSAFSNLDAYSTLMNRVNNMFGEHHHRPDPSLQKFSNALQAVANNP